MCGLRLFQIELDPPQQAVSIQPLAQGGGIGADFVKEGAQASGAVLGFCLLYTSPSPRDKRQSRMPSSA